MDVSKPHNHGESSGYGVALVLALFVAACILVVMVVGRAFTA